MSHRIRRQPTLTTLQVRGLAFQFYRWEAADRSTPPLVCLHGWGDSGETFQFIVDHLPPNTSVISFDARGFGRTEWPQDGYWFPDYLADLDIILDTISPHEPVDLLGHSMGGNVAMLYAGVRTQRVRRLINLEGLGLQPTTPDMAPSRLREWLDEVKDGPEFATYRDYAQFEKVLARRNPRTPPEHIAFIARSWGVERADGTIALRCDPRHKRVNPVLYQRDQAEACWRNITAPVLFVVGGKSDIGRRLGSDAAIARLQQSVQLGTVTALAEAGHMVHHEFPQEVAELIQRFCR